MRAVLRSDEANLNENELNLKLSREEATAKNALRLEAELSVALKYFGPLLKQFPSTRRAASSAVLSTPIAKGCPTTTERWI